MEPTESLQTSPEAALEPTANSLKPTLKTAESLEATRKAALEPTESLETSSDTSLEAAAKALKSSLEAAAEALKATTNTSLEPTGKAATNGILVSSNLGHVDNSARSSVVCTAKALAALLSDSSEANTRALTGIRAAKALEIPAANPLVVSATDALATVVALDSTTLAAHVTISVLVRVVLNERILIGRYRGSGGEAATEPGLLCVRIRNRDRDDRRESKNQSAAEKKAGGLTKHTDSLIEAKGSVRPKAVQTCVYRLRTSMCARGTRRLGKLALKTKKARARNWRGLGY